MPPSQSDVIRFLSQPEAYPHHPEQVRHIQTHISHVFIATPYVYKLKKARNLGFLDFTTLEQRIHFCHQEVVLNRRLCRGIYLGVTGIHQTAGGGFELRESSAEPETDLGAEAAEEPLSSSGGDTDSDQVGTGQIASDEGLSGSEENETGSEPEGDSLVEVVVKMRVLDPDRLLIQIVENRSLAWGHLERVADHLAPFYRRQREQGQRDRQIRRWGDPEVIRGNAEENFQQTERFVGTILDRVTFDAVRYYSGQFVTRFRPLLVRRQVEGRIVDGHGDLHLEHICLNQKQICIYDCIEFTERFRCLDIASDVAFLTMDLDGHGYTHLANRFADRMAEQLDDPDLVPLGDFYRCYRAWVRGKVKSFESREIPMSEEGHQQAADQARAYFKLSLKYALFGSAPTLLVMTGRVASGKSSLAEGMADLLGCRYYSSDRLRKSSAGLSPDEVTPSDIRVSLYTDEMRRRIYQRLSDLASDELESGRPVILDATFGDRRHRQRIVELAEAQQADLVFVEAGASYQIRDQRLRARDRQAGVISDARIGDMEMLDQRYEPPDEVPSDRLIRVDTGMAVEQTLDQLCRSLSERHLERQGRAMGI